MSDQDPTRDASPSISPSGQQAVPPSVEPAQAPWAALNTARPAPGTAAGALNTDPHATPTSPAPTIDPPATAPADATVDGGPHPGTPGSGPPGTPHFGPPMSGPPMSGPPMSGPPMSGPPTSGPMSGFPVSGPPYPPVSGQPGTAPRPARRGGRIVALATAAAVLAIGSGLTGGFVATRLDGGGGGTTVITRNAAPTLDRSSVGDVAAKVLPSVVDITTGSGEGSGVILSADGLIVTNNHVVADARQLRVTFSDGKTANASVVGSDPAGDLAVIKAEGVSGLTAARFGDSDALQVGDTVLAVGSPLGLQGSVTAGIVSALHRTISSRDNGGRSIADAIQTDAAINPGNSGGALVNLAGEVVGINTAIATAGENSGNIGVGFAISANRARAAADQLVNGGKVSHPYLGVGLTDGSGGALIGNVVAGGPADKAGLKTGDLVVKAGGTTVTDAADLIGAVQAGKVGDQLRLTVTRDGSQQEITVTLGEAP